MFGQCFDKNDNLLNTIISDNTAQQLGDDYDITTWNFSNVYIYPNYANIKFGISENSIPSDNDFNPQPNTHPIKCFELNTGAWGTIDQGNTAAPNKTLRFTFTTVIRRNDNIKGHITNNQIHITPSEKEIIKNLSSDIDERIEEVSATID